MSRGASTQRKKAAQWAPLKAQRKLKDEHVFEGLNLDYPPLKKVKSAWLRKNIEEAKAELLKYFRARKTPQITPYKTDNYWSDWPSHTVERRADLVLQKKILKRSKDKTVVDVRGKKSDPNEMNWDKVVKTSHNFSRQSITAEFVAAWSKTGKKKYLKGLEGWLGHGNLHS